MSQAKRSVRMRTIGSALCLWLLLVGTAVSASAEVVRVVIDRREDVLGGRAWADAGAYEKLVGRIFFEFDPENPANAAVVDLSFAPLNGNGKVEVWADLVVLQPRDPGARRGIGWVEVSNRGGKASLSYFNRAQGALDPTMAEHFGDGLLFEEGLTVVWIGWQWDVPDRAGALRLHVPVARGGTEAISGLVRSDWTIDAPAETLGLSHRGHRTYAASDPANPRNVLTVRDGRELPRTEVPRSRWRFEAAPDGQEAERLTRVRLEGGFEAGKIYELVYVSEDPRIVGLGLAAIRDVASYAKYDLRSEFPVMRTVGFGVSQTGRFLRQFLYQGFNVDEQGRAAYDGLLIHTAGAGRGSFNHRFGQPSRDGHPYSAFFYPTDLYPFTSARARDPVAGRNEGLLDAIPEALRPKTFFTNTGYEYWGRAASLIHTSPDGMHDADPLATERIYHLSSAQHFWRPGWPAQEAHLGVADAYRGSPLNHLITLRALAMRLIEWVEDDVEPPPSAYPRISDGTLVPVAGLAFPRIAGLDVPSRAHVAYRASYGPRWRDGIIDEQPPRLGAPFPTLVPQVDGIGNEVSGIRSLEVRAPLATYAPWNLRLDALGGVDALTDFVGTYAPLLQTEIERREAGDARPSLEGLYGDKGGYLARVRAAAERMVEQGILLDRDRGYVVQRAAEHWDWLHSRR